MTDRRAATHYVGTRPTFLLIEFDAETETGNGATEAANNDLTAVNILHIASIIVIIVCYSQRYRQHNNVRKHVPNEVKTSALK